MSLFKIIYFWLSGIPALIPKLISVSIECLLVVHCTESGVLTCSLLAQTTASNMVFVLMFPSNMQPNIFDY